MKRIAVFALLLLGFQTLNAQKWAVSTNLVGYAALGTLNAGLSYAVGQHWSFEAGGRYNPFTYKSSDGQKQLRLRSAEAGVRWWPWHVHSGWWAGPKVQYMEYSIGGIITQRTVEGDMAGAGVKAGYTHMLSSNLNLEFGLAVWGGYQKYVVYDCPHCGIKQDGGKKVFFLPDDAIVSLNYLF